VSLVTLRVDARWAGGPEPGSVVRVERTDWVDTLISGGQVTELGVEDELPFKPELPAGGQDAGQAGGEAGDVAGDEAGPEAGGEAGGGSQGDVEREASSLGKKGSARGPKASQRGRKTRDDPASPAAGTDRGEGT
jgi:hypothetical protein